MDTTGGTKVGVIGDAILDEEGRIRAFSLSRVFVEGPVAESRTIYQAAIVDKGQVDGLMTVDLAKVEQQSQAGEIIEEAALQAITPPAVPPAMPEDLPAEELMEPSPFRLEEEE